MIPVFRGGALFEECLASVVEKQDAFEKIVISLNGVDNSRDMKAIRVAKLDSTKLVILETKSDLRPEVHHLFITTELADLNYDAWEPVLLLFHDDHLISTNFPSNLSKAVVAGPWRVFGEDIEETTEYLIDEPKADSADWVRGVGFHKRFTNGSGIVAPLEVLNDVSRQMTRYGSGVRYEHMILTHPKVDTIVSSPSPLVAVRAHAAQEGANQSLRNFIAGEVMFVFWLAGQKRFKLIGKTYVCLFVSAALALGVARRIMGLLLTTSA